MQIVLLLNIVYYLLRHSPQLVLCPCGFASHCQAKSMPRLAVIHLLNLGIALRTPGIF